MKKILYLHLKTKYFEQIRCGEKTEEYRLHGNYWCSRLDFTTYDEIHVLKGYPKKGDSSRRLIFPWNGYQIKKINHPEFGNDEVCVYAIRLCNDDLIEFY